MPNECETNKEKGKETQQEARKGADHEVSLSGEDEYTYETDTETDSTAEIARRIAKEDL